MTNSEFNNSNQWVLPVYLLCQFPAHPWLLALLQAVLVVASSLASVFSVSLFCHQSSSLFTGPYIQFSLLKGLVWVLFSSRPNWHRLTCYCLIPFICLSRSSLIQGKCWYSLKFTQSPLPGSIIRPVRNLESWVPSLIHSSPLLSHSPHWLERAESTLTLSPSPGIHACGSSPLVFSLGPPQLISHPEPKVILLKYK